MVDRAKLFERLLATFVDEVAEHVESLNSGVLSLESQQTDAERAETLTVMFRAAHSLKGASRAVDVLPIETVCHRLEDVLSALRDGKLQMTPEIGSAVLSVSDAIAEAGELLRARQPVEENHFNDMPDRLQRIAAGETPQAASKTEPSAEKLLQNGPDETVEADAEKSATLTPQLGSDLKNVSTAENVSLHFGSSDNVAADIAAANSTASAEGVTDASEETCGIQVLSDGETSGVQIDSGVDSSESVSNPVRQKESAPPRRGLGNTVRVAEEKLDSLMAQAGELLVARQRIEVRPKEVEESTALAAECRAEFQSIQRSLLALIQQNGNDALLQRSSRLTGRMEQIVEQTGDKLRQLEASLEGLQQRLLMDSRQLNHTGEALQEDIHRIRMLPFGDGCAGLDRAVRDAATATGKQVEFSIDGADIEVDRTVLEGLRDPLLHLIRNSIDHGLESPADRQKAGKSEAGHVKVSATLRGSQVDITVTDDGKGLNRQAILNKLRSKGLAEPRDDQELYRSIFQPGFSTAEIVTGLSGRGVGLDIVKSQLELLHGTIDLSSQPGFGTRFSLSVPLTLTTISALFVRERGQSFALPSTNVSRLVRFESGDVKSMSGQDVMSLGGSPIPVTTLGSALGLQRGESATPRKHLTGVVLTTGDRELIVIVDELVNEREAVVKNLGPQIRRLRHVSGATLLRNGGIALLLNVATLVRSQTTSGLAMARVDWSSDVVAVSARRVLVVDDSVTTRSLLKGILESAGYDVTAAVDGQDAWNRLQNSDIELVVSDVDMPNMDGFELTSQIRKSEQYEHLPVVLVTSRDTDEDKAKGVQAGADAYLVKSSFQQTDVLDTIEQLL